MLIRAFALMCVAGLLAVPAEAQIYAWRDANGTLVLSDRKLAEGARTFSVPEAPGIRSTRPATPRAARERYEPLIEQYAGRHSLRPDLVRAVIQVESGFNSRARSPKGAMGLMQLMPATARELGVDDPYDPDANIRGGTAYLRRLIDRYEGNEELALAAYNAGSAAVERYGRVVPPYRETRDYVKRIGTVSAVNRTARKTKIYKWVEIVDGRPITRYSTQPQAAVSGQLVARR